MKKSCFALLILVLALLPACMPASPTAAPEATLPPTSETGAAPTVLASTPEPTPTSWPSPSPSVTPTALPVEPTPSVPAASLPEISSSTYLDDRSTPAAVILSYFNAVNRFEYLRAYSYYPPEGAPASLEDFTAGYTDTASVSVTIGEVFSEGAAGSFYSVVPAILDVTTTGAREKFAACYVLRLPNPGAYGAPPVTPRHIVRGAAQAINLNATDVDALSTACPAPDFPSGPGAVPTSLEDLSDLSSANYIDNRSGAVEVASSLLNAVNRREFARAYTYWKDPKEDYAAFEAGFAGVESVSAQFGTPIDDPGAGQIYFSLPAVLSFTMTDGSTRLESACYTLHLSQPGFQGTAPFIPLGIRSLVVEQMDASADPATLLASACQ